jgi:hypothetical protein
MGRTEIMADFCKQCSIDIFGKDFRELAGLGDGSELKEDEGWMALCEGCGPTVVDDDGRCISVNCMKEHGKK